jgi:hypothetical protein
MTKSIHIGMSFPTEIINKINRERGDPRSRYALRILEQTYVNPGPSPTVILKKQNLPNESSPRQILDLSASG